MDAIVRLQPKSSYATVSAALSLTRGRRVALVFPVGERTCLHDTTLLSALRSRCAALGKEVVIIGGDAWLRAHAVATGFETATTLEDWGDTAPEHCAIAPHHASLSSPRLRLVAPHAPRLADTSIMDAFEMWMSEPPDYVVALRSSFASQSPVVRAPVAPETLPSAVRTEDNDVAVTSEIFEEMIIGRILETSGIHRTQIPGVL